MQLLPEAHEIGPWQREPPNRDGDWLWVACWESCGCVIKSGMAWVEVTDAEGIAEYEKRDADAKPECHMKHEVEPGVWMYISFGPPEQSPCIYPDGRRQISWWREITIPATDYHEVHEEEEE